MGFEIVRLKEKDNMEKYVLEEDMEYVIDAKSGEPRLKGEKDRSAFLLGHKGQSISGELAVKLGLMKAAKPGENKAAKKDAEK